MNRDAGIILQFQTVDPKTGSVEMPSNNVNFFWLSWFA
jgi:hypothetical protein